MSKIIKLKESDIRKIAKTVLEQQFNNPNTHLQREETPMNDGVELTLGMDDNGNYYVMKNATSEDGVPEIVAKT